MSAIPPNFTRFFILVSLNKLSCFNFKESGQGADDKFFTSLRHRNLLYFIDVLAGLFNHTRGSRNNKHAGNRGHFRHFFRLFVLLVDQPPKGFSL